MTSFGSCFAQGDGDWHPEDTDDTASSAPSESCSPLGNPGRRSPFVVAGGTRRLRRTAEVVAEEMRSAGVDVSRSLSRLCFEA